MDEDELYIKKLKINEINIFIVDKIFIWIYLQCQI